MTARKAEQATKAVVLVNGGVDSATCLALAACEFKASNVLALSVFYGQRHARELESARALCAHYGVAHRELDLSGVLADSRNALMAESDLAVPHESYAQQQQAQTDAETPVSTYVPFRNGLMLAAAASLALSVFPNERIDLYLGAHADDAAGSAYPDCSPAFVSSLGAAISTGTYGLVTLRCPFASVGKDAVVREGLALGVPFKLTWSCYEGAEQPCGTCATCIDRIRAFRANGVEDPLQYA